MIEKNLIKRTETIVSVPNPRLYLNYKMKEHIKLFIACLVDFQIIVRKILKFLKGIVYSCSTEKKSPYSFNPFTKKSQVFI